MFSSKSFIVSGLTFTSIIHFEFIFVYGVKKCSNFIFLQCSCQVFPAPLIEEAVFVPLYMLVSFVKNKVPIGAWVYFLAFYLVPLVYISVFVPVPYCLDDCQFSSVTQSCPTLCDTIDGSPPGSVVPEILQARTLEWVAISFSRRKL